MFKPDYANIHHRNETVFGSGVLGEGQVVGDLRASAGVNVINEQPERWKGRVEPDGNLGRTDLLVGVSVSYPVGSFRLGAGAKFPIYQRIIESDEHDGGQLTNPRSAT